MLKNTTRGIYRRLAINVEGFPVAFKAEIALLGLGRHGARFTSENGGKVLGSKGNSGFPGTVSSQQRVQRTIWGKCSRGTEQCATVSGTSECPPGTISRYKIHEPTSQSVS